MLCATLGRFTGGLACLPTIIKHGVKSDTKGSKKDKEAIADATYAKGYEPLPSSGTKKQIVGKNCEVPPGFELPPELAEELQERDDDEEEDRGFWGTIGHWFKGGSHFRLYGQSGNAGIEWDATDADDGDDLIKKNPFKEPATD